MKQQAAEKQTLELEPIEHEARRGQVAAHPQHQLAPAGAQAEGHALMTIIERISQMPEIDLDRVERLFDMHQKMVDRQQEQAFNEAMAQTQSEIQAVVAKKKNTHTNSLYADIDAVHEQAKPVWTRNGFSVVTRTAPSQIQNHVKVICEVRHSGGHKECHEDDWPLDTSGSQGKANKTAIQGKGSSATYARRYTELMIFDIAIKRQDKDGNAPKEGPKLITKTETMNIMGLIQQAGMTPEQFCHNGRINAVHELQASRYQAAVNSLNAKIKKLKESAK